MSMRSHAEQGGTTRRVLRSWIGLVLVACVLSACARDSRRQPACDYCGMLIAQEGFGGRLTKADGTTLVFDASECMAAFSLYKIDPHAIRRLRSVDYERADTLLDAARAWYLHSDKRPSPMTMNLSAYASRAAAERARDAVGGELLTWAQVRALVRRRWLEGKRD